MKTSFLSLMAVAAVAVVIIPQPTEGIWRELVPVLREQIKSLWQTNDLQFLGSSCTYRQKPRIRRFQLYFNGEFKCNNFPGITGKNRTRSRSSVMNNTIEDFLNKLKNSGRISEQEAQIWLDGFADK